MLDPSVKCSIIVSKKMWPVSFSAPHRYEDSNQMMKQQRLKFPWICTFGWVERFSICQALVASMRIWFADAAYNEGKNYHMRKVSVKLRQHLLHGSWHAFRLALRLFKFTRSHSDYFEVFSKPYRHEAVSFLTQRRKSRSRFACKLSFIHAIFIGFQWLAVTVLET